MTPRETVAERGPEGRILKTRSPWQAPKWLVCGSLAWVLAELGGIRPPVQDLGPYNRLAFCPISSSSTSPPNVRGAFRPPNGGGDATKEQRET